jgi:hypothetical protein
VDYFSRYSLDGLLAATVEPQNALTERAKTVAAGDDRILALDLVGGFAVGTGDAWSDAPGLGGNWCRCSRCRACPDVVRRCHSERERTIGGQPRDNARCAKTHDVRHAEHRAVLVGGDGVGDNAVKPDVIRCGPVHVCFTAADGRRDDVRRSISGAPAAAGEIGAHGAEAGWDVLGWQGGGSVLGVVAVMVAGSTPDGVAEGEDGASTWGLTVETDVVVVGGVTKGLP